MLNHPPPFFLPRRRADPLDKAEAYATLRGPYLLNDLGMQRIREQGWVRLDVHPEGEGG